jgi:hypothetical protein
MTIQDILADRELREMIDAIENAVDRLADADYVCSAVLDAHELREDADTDIGNARSQVAALKAISSPAFPPPVIKAARAVAETGHALERVVTFLQELRERAS